MVSQGDWLRWSLAVLKFFQSFVTVNGHPPNNMENPMRLPADNAAYDQLIAFGRYVTRRLRRKKMTALAQDAEAATTKVKSLGRAWEDAAEPLQDALADRDGADDDLDLIAKEIRQVMASRGLDAVKKSPYIDVFPQGIEYYTAAPLDEEEKRYGELQTRLEKFLPADDALRPRIEEIKEGIASFREASIAVDKQRGELAIGRSTLDGAIDSWRRYMNKLYGTLVSQVEKAAAERFFPKTRAARTEKTDAEA